jgi:putative selenate reductase
MAELVPIPLPLLLRRAFLEYSREGKIFDLPATKFFRGIPGLDLSVEFHGHRAATPLGPAAGPHGQLSQNIALSWLGGARIIELKTVQILDELKIPRPCIDVANVGYNVEWSQELKLEQSLREYVKAAMLLGTLKASGVIEQSLPDGRGSDDSSALQSEPRPGYPLGVGSGCFFDTVFDMSVGYNLEGIRSPRVRSWIASMQNAGPVIEDLRAELAGEFQRYRDLPFPTCISDTISLSTFHGCPADEIEGIVTFLLVEMGCHVCIKLNPTLLGQEEVAHLLHDVLGYREIQLHPPAFASDLQFDEALDLIPRLQRLAHQHGRSLSLKFTNTLVVKNHKQVFGDEVMYLSGAPLHVLAMNLVQKFRARMRDPIPISFSGGLDAHNVAAAVAMNFVPVTTCTDLLRPGGYARLSRYLANLGAEMQRVGASNIAEFVQRYRGQGGNVHTAGLRNTPILVAEAMGNPRYAWERNQGVPRKIGTKLWLYDCINCDKCVPVCPNDANFAYETRPETIEYDNFELLWDKACTASTDRSLTVAAPIDATASPIRAATVRERLPAQLPFFGDLFAVRRIPGGVLRIVKAHQLANYADACNDCGNCDIFCPEDGGPQVEKPRFFGSRETYEADAGANGFYIDWDARTIHGTLACERYTLAVDAAAGRAWFHRTGAAVEIRLSDHEVLAWRPTGGAGPATCTLDMLPYFKLKLLMESIGDPRHVHFANVAGLQENPSES